MLYHLMNRNIVVASYEESTLLDNYTYTLVEQFDEYLPYGFTTIDDWIDGRQIAKHRSSIERLMRELGMTTRHDFIGMARCLSLTDTFWMKQAEEQVSWENINLYTNPFDDVVSRIAFDGTGMYGRENSPTSPEFATSGSFDKCWIRTNEGIFLLKRGSEGFSNTGFEPYSEALVSTMLDFTGTDHVHYDLVNYHKKLASKCPIFTSEQYGFVAAHRFFDHRIDDAEMLRFTSEHGCEEQFREMVVLDSVVANTDRHAGNYGFMVDNETGDITGMAPVFDNNYALLPLMTETEDMRTYIATHGPKIGTTFDSIAKLLMTPSIKSKLIALKDFEFQDPGFGFPKWKLDRANQLKEMQVNSILKA